MIIAFSNQKGGVSKSTACINVGAALAKMKKKVLVIDMDPQANLTSGVGIVANELDKTVYDLLKIKDIGYEEITKVICNTPYENLHCIPSNIALSNAEIELSSNLCRESILRNIVSFINKDFDYILIDTPPSLGLLNINSMVAANSVVVPVCPDYFSIKGLEDLMNTLNLVKKNLNPNLQLMGVLLTLYDGRINLSKSTRDSLLGIFGDTFFKSIIRRDCQIQYSQEEHIPLIYYNQKCRAYKDFISFAQEVLRYEK